MRVGVLLVFVLGLFRLWGQDTPESPKLRNEAAVARVRSGQQEVASAGWWGFDPQDSTAALQAALNSGAKRLVIPFMGDPWIVRPLALPSNQEILLEPGVVLLAKPGEFQGAGDSLLTAVGCSNLVIRGYGACLRMRKGDYQHAPYKAAEWRMGLALRGCRRIVIEGLRVESSGGDGFYIDGGPDLGWSEDITLRNCAAYDNHRQGVSVISAVNLLIENCLFANTWGTAPEAGIDLEPDTESQRLVNCVIRDSIFENNNGHQILIYLKPLTTNSQPVSIRFENCLARMTLDRMAGTPVGPTNAIKGVAGIAVGEIQDNGPAGQIDFINCVTQDTTEEGARVYDKSASSARVRFLNCAFQNPWRGQSGDTNTARAALLLELRHPERTSHPGGVDFSNTSVYDSAARPALLYRPQNTQLNLQDVRGNILVRTPGPAPALLGPATPTVQVTLTPLP